MLITLTTDFGYRDPFVGVMKGVILGINPQARILDLSHGIPPQDVPCAALLLRHAVSYFPDGTIHVAVIDPGVGSARRPLLMKSGNRYLIGPDNGVLSLALGKEKPDYAVCLSNAAYHLKPASATFHGRDIFSPVAAHLTLGIPPAAFGDRVNEFVRLSLPAPTKSVAGVEGEIVYIDGFGNLFTNIEERDLAGFGREQVTISFSAGSIRGIGESYSAARQGEYVAVINSWGVLEIAVYRGSAQEHARAKLGDKVLVVSGP